MGIAGYLSPPAPSSSATDCGTMPPLAPQAPIGKQAQGSLHDLNDLAAEYGEESTKVCCRANPPTLG